MALQIYVTIHARLVYADLLVDRQSPVSHTIQNWVKLVFAVGWGGESKLQGCVNLI